MTLTMVVLTCQCRRQELKVPVHQVGKIPGRNGITFQCFTLNPAWTERAWCRLQSMGLASQMHQALTLNNKCNSCSQTDLYPRIFGGLIPQTAQELVISLACDLYACSFKMSSDIPQEMCPAEGPTELEERMVNKQGITTRRI